MSKHQSFSPVAFGSASGIPPGERRGGVQSATRPPVQGEIGIVGLGHMGTAMAANLTAAGRRVIAYVRRPDQIGKLAAPGLRPTTDIVDLRASCSSSPRASRPMSSAASRSSTFSDKGLL